jgi:peptide/nickel transport system substrate-binding protein
MPVCIDPGQYLACSAPAGPVQFAGLRKPAPLKQTRIPTVMTMIDLRPNPERDVWARGVEPSGVTGLIQARIDGKLSRRNLISRAAALGYSSAVIGIMLHATSDRAFGAPRPTGPSASGNYQSRVVPATQATAPTGTPLPGGTIVVGVTDEPASLHPWLSPDRVTRDVCSGIFDTLLSYDSTQQLQPALAESFSVSEDGLTYTFALRQGVKWHDGTDFTAQDFIDSWTMIMTPDFGAVDQQGWDKIVEARAEGTNLVVVTSEPFVPFISYVGGTHVICPSSAMAAGPQAFKEQFGQSLIGTGPLTFAGWTAGEQIVLARNPTYWGGAPALDQIIVRFLPDDATQLAQLGAGEIQMAAGTGALGPTRVDEALAIPNIVVLEHQTLGWAHLDLKNIGFLRETLVRQALDFATPTQQIIDEVLKGRAIRAIGDVAPNTPFFNDQIQPRAYSQDQARALLAEAGFTEQDGLLKRNGEQLAIQLWAVEGSSLAEQIVGMVAQSWNEVGVKTDVFFGDASTIWGPEGYQFTDNMTACFYSWFNGNDPDNQYYWHSKFIPTSPTASGGNLPAYFFSYSFQAEIDELTYMAATEFDPDLRRELYFQIQELLYREVPVIFLYWGIDYAAVTPKLGGFWPSAYTRLLWNVKDWYLVE